ncbi:MAG: 2-C-methyl-D-erythritol 4-phosphate cytidylyltransferase, partial [Gemmatimonadales bacterium]|nr:2-C-methyl-D-erythritol 4-phosphate cytidylyltransferase [Gemmatimonadales bacterium]
MPPDVGVIVVAAGRGVRAGGTTPKQFQEVAGAPLVLHALRPFLRHPAVGTVVLVLPTDQAAAPARGWRRSLASACSWRLVA